MASSVWLRGRNVWMSWPWEEKKWRDLNWWSACVVRSEGAGVPMGLIDEVNYGKFLQWRCWESVKEGYLFANQMHSYLIAKFPFPFIFFGKLNHLPCWTDYQINCHLIRRRSPHKNQHLFISLTHFLRKKTSNSIKVRHGKHETQRMALLRCEWRRQLAGDMFSM